MRLNSLFIDGRLAKYNIKTWAISLKTVDDIATSEDILGEIILYKPLLENIIVYYIVGSLIYNNIILWKVASQVGPV